VSTAWVGRLGAVELAGVGVALSVYGAITKLLNMPLLAVITSTTATALGRSEKGGERSKQVGVAVASALALAAAAGAVQAGFLAIAGLPGLSLWGAGPASPLHASASAYLTVRAWSAPASVVFLALQGTFRGLGDTRAPLLATVVSNAINVVLEPLFIFHFRWGVGGAAMAIAVAQVASAAGLWAILSSRVDLKGLNVDALRDAAQYARPTGLLVLRTYVSSNYMGTCSHLLCLS
jgi:putative MATE family efflux protein